MQFDPVFFDQTGRRWRVTKYLLILVVIGLVSLPTAFLISVFKLQTRPGIQVTVSDSDTGFQFGRVARRTN
jgi:hypothetical protein